MKHLGIYLWRVLYNMGGQSMACEPHMAPFQLKCSSWSLCALPTPFSTSQTVVGSSERLPWGRVVQVKDSAQQGEGIWGGARGVSKFSHHCYITQSITEVSRWYLFWYWIQCYVVPTFSDVNMCRFVYWQCLTAPQNCQVGKQKDFYYYIVGAGCWHGRYYVDTELKDST